MRHKKHILSFSARQDAENLYQSHIGFIQNYSRTLTGGSSDPEDLVQDTLIRIMEHMDTLLSMPVGKQTVYIALIMKSLYINQRKKAHPGQQVHLTDEQMRLLPDPAEREDHQQARLEVALLLEQLKPEDQLLLSGWYLIGWSAKELAALLGCKESSIRSKLSRARKRALELLPSNGGEPHE